MIVKESVIDLKKFSNEFALDYEGNKEIYKDAIYFDLEHYVYKKPICIGVFGCCYFNCKENNIKVTQYMIENKKDSREILNLSKKYFLKMAKELNKKYIVTFSGNNDFTMINYLYEKYKINLEIKEKFKEIDLQKEYEKIAKTSIGLKKLETIFDITREGDVISGSNLAKTFAKIIKDDGYINRMPEEKKKNILVYNRQDVVSLVIMNILWNKYIK